MGLRYRAYAPRIAWPRGGGTDRFQPGRNAPGDRGRPRPRVGRSNRRVENDDHRQVTTTRVILGNVQSRRQTTGDHIQLWILDVQWGESLGCKFRQTVARAKVPKTGRLLDRAFQP